MMRSGLWVVAGMLAGCVVPEPSTGSVEQDVTGCPPLVCGGNSPEIDHYKFHDLNIAHRRNYAGFVLFGLVKDHVAYDVAVVNGELMGLIGGTPKLVGYDLFD